jgi:hypothetical protein
MYSAKTAFFRSCRGGSGRRGQRDGRKSLYSQRLGRAIVACRNDERTWGPAALGRVFGLIVLLIADGAAPASRPGLSADSGRTARRGTP